MSDIFDAIWNGRLYLVAATVSLLTSLFVTPLVRWLATRFDIVDHPDEHRKLHSRITPLGGGVAVIASFASSVAIVAFFSDSQREVFTADRMFIVGLTMSSLAICGVGLLDDRFNLRGRQKLIGQIIAALFLIFAGLCIRQVQIFDWTIQLGLLSIPFTLFWMLGAINALNFIDGVDGLATGVGIVLSLAIAVIAGLTGHRTEAFLALAMSGSLIGFLVYNRPPATIFLGDAGSMLIGLVLGALAIRGSFKGPATVAMAAPIAMWAIPIFDVMMAILRRRLTGRSIYTTDRAHLHHSLLKRGFSSTKTATVFGFLCASTALGAVISVIFDSELVAFGVIIAVLATLVMTRFYGHHESRLLGQRLKHFVWSLVPMISAQDAKSRQLHTRLEGDQQWEELWSTLTGFAERFDLNAVQLNITLPAHGEEFHASWHRKESFDEKELWHSDIPLYAWNVSIGRLKITGNCADDSVFNWMSELIAGLQPFETQLLDLVSDCIGPAVHGSGGERDRPRIEPPLSEQSSDAFQLDELKEYASPD